MSAAEMTNEELINTLRTMQVTGITRTEREIIEEACNRIEKLDRVERWIVEQTVKPQMRKVFNGYKE